MPGLKRALCHFLFSVGPPALPVQFVVQARDAHHRVPTPTSVVLPPAGDGQRGAFRRRDQPPGAVATEGGNQDGHRCYGGQTQG